MNNIFEYVDSNKYYRDISLLQPAIKKNKILAIIVIVAAVILIPLMFIVVVAEAVSGELSASTIFRFLVGIMFIIGGITNYTGRYKPIKKLIMTAYNDMCTSQLAIVRTQICEIQQDQLTNYFATIKGNEKNTVDRLFLIKTVDGAVYRCNRIAQLPPTPQVNIQAEITYYMNSRIISKITIF